jgi:hypothetical protein
VKKNLFSLIYSLILFGFLHIIFVPLAEAQNQVTIAGQDVSLRLGLTLQPRFSYALEDENTQDFERLGFGVRRFRFKMYAGFGEDFRLFAQLEGAGTSAQVLDLRAEYSPLDNLWIRVGRFAGAQPRSMAFTLHSEIDMVDRAAIADFWARNTLGADARDYGIEFLYRPAKTEYRIFIHNGDNRNNFRGGPADDNMTERRNDKGMAISSAIRYFPNNDVHTDLGGYFGVNTSKNSYTIHPSIPGVGRTYMSGSMHGYRGTFAGHFPIRVKFDAIIIKYEDITSNSVKTDQLFTGISLFGGYLVRPDTELMLRAERLDRDANQSDNEAVLLSTGITYSFSAARNKNFLGQKITAIYSFKDDLHLQKKTNSIVIQLQILL